MKAGEANEVYIILKKQSGCLTIATDPVDAIISVDNKIIDSNTIDLNDGIHEIVISCKGYKTLKKEVKIEEGEAKNLSFVLKKLN